MKKKLSPLYLGAAALALLFTTSKAHAQAGTSLGPSPLAPTAVPIDGGASLLLASGVAYGLKKLRDRRRGR